jgi:hypothetical protein
MYYTGSRVHEVREGGDDNNYRSPESDRGTCSFL